MKSCFCGGKYDGAQCQRDDCPRARLGYGSCHMALSKLWNVASSSSGGNPVKLEPVAVYSDGDWYQSDGERLEVTQVEPSAPSEATTGYAVSTHVWLTFLLLPVVSALCYLNEVVRLAFTPGWFRNQ